MDNIIGRKLDGRYEIQEVIGVGGMAIVYKAYDSIDDRIVAVKILKEEYLTNEDFKRRFKNESKAIAVLSHPNIVKVYDVSFGEKLQYIVMEFIDGITLKEYIDQQNVLTWKEAVHFTVQILRALQHAHEKGIVHRDIKPQNIMMLEDGTIKVADFGIARFANSETRTMTDKAIGSVHYISPEQARGGETDEKSDLYSVGVMLFEMLTGQLPFESDSAVSVAIMQMQQEPKHPREINPNIPEGLEDIILRAMQKDPQQRYQSAAEMLDDIEKFKQNPSIRFEYKYFIDESPTKYVDAINKIKKTEEPAGDNKKNKKKSPVIPVLSGVAGALTLVALIGVIIVLAITGYLPFSKVADVTVPNLVGQKLTDVQASTKYKNFQIKQKSTQYDDSVAAGSIVSQSPAADTKAKKNSTINVVVSLGPQQAKVPDVTGEELSKAEVDLSNAGFKDYQVTQVYDSSAVKGTVVRTDPAKNTTAPISTSVTIYVSIGVQVQIVTVPNVVGMSYDDAKNTLEGLGLKVGSTSYKSSNLPLGTVVSQNPSSGTSTAQNQTVNLVLSDGGK